MAVWLDTMPLMERIFFYMALPATLVLLIQTIMLFFGGSADSGLDSDTSGMSDVDFSTDAALSSETLQGDLDDVVDASDLTSASGLRFLTMRGIITFLTIFGWSGVCLMEIGLPLPLVLLISSVLGFGAMVAVAFLVRGLMSLQASGNINYRDALGKHGDIYLTIPPKGEGSGKISLTLGGSLKEYDAITDDNTPIQTGDVARVIDIVRDNILVVERDIR